MRAGRMRGKRTDALPKQVINTASSRTWSTFRPRSREPDCANSARGARCRRSSARAGCARSGSTEANAGELAGDIRERDVQHVGATAEALGRGGGR